MPTSVKIDFLVAGFSKCGTTTLCAALARHPDIFIPEVKEPRYFSSTDFESGHERYDKLFESAQSNQKKGEGSPSYSSAQREDDSIRRIHENNPDCKFVFIARHPRRRIESSYREMHHSGVRFGFNAPYGLAECLDTFPQMINDTLFYARIEKYLQTFGEEAVRIVFLEDLTANMKGELEKCCEHIGVNPLDFPELGEVRLNSGTAKLYDTRLLRRLRVNRFAGPRIARLQPSEQDNLFAKLKLRLAFKKKPIQWDDCSESRFNKIVKPDARRFLELCNKPPAFWQLER
jgi:hypothetical protein